MEEMSLLNRVKTLWQKKSVKNGMWLYGLQFINTVIPIVTLPYLTRILGSSEYGVFNIAINFISYLQVVVEYGFGMSATRQTVLLLNEDNGVYPNRKDNSEYDIRSLEKYRKLFSGVLYTRMLLLGLSVLITFGYVMITPYDNHIKLCLIILFSSLIGTVFQQNWLFQGMQDMKYISITGITVRLVSVVLIFCFVKTAENLYLYCVLYSLSTIIGSLVGFFVAIVKYRMRLIKNSLQDIIFQLKDGWYIFTTSFSAKVFGAIGVTFLGLFATNSEVGIYSAIQRIPNLIMMAWAPIAQVIYPISSGKFSHSYQEGKAFVKKIKKSTMPLFGALCVIIGLFSKPIISIAFGEEYGTKFFWIIPLLAWLLIGIDNNFVGSQTMIASGHDKEYSRCFIIGVVATVVFNFLFIYLLKGTGASLAPMVSEITLNLVLRRSIKRYERMAIN